MNKYITSSPSARVIKSPCSSGQSNGGQWTGTGTAEKEPLSTYGPQIAQTALLSVGLSNRDLKGTRMSTLEYAEVASIIFTKATNQAIMLGTEPRHVLSTSLLRTSLLHDKRFRQIPMSEAAPGDIILESVGHQASGHAGIVVDHGRIVGMGRTGTVQNNSSLLELQSNRRPVFLFRYIGVQKRPSFPLANAGYNDNELRLPKGQPGGGQWATAPSTLVLSGGNNWTPRESDPGSATRLTDAQRNLFRQKNAEAMAIIAKYGDKGEAPDTPESILNGPLNSSLPNWNPISKKADLRSRYKGFSDEDIALMESARRNGVRALVALADAGKLPQSQVTPLQLRGMGLMAETTMNMGLALVPYERIAELAAKGLLGATEATLGQGAGESAYQSEKTAASLEKGTKYADSETQFGETQGLIKGVENGKPSAAGAAQEIPPLRQAYEIDVRALKSLELSARSAGQDAESIARMLSAKRDALKVQYLELTPPDSVKVFEQRNMNKYGNPLGPTVEQLRSRGKTWEQIIESASRPGGEDLGF